MTIGSHAYIERLGPRARSLVAAFAIEMSGWKRGSPVLHPFAYADAREQGRAVIAPAWLVRAALAGSRESGAPIGVGDPWLAWLYQPAVRAFRVRLNGDDLSFLQTGHAALFASDSSFSAFYPDYHKASDTADKLDAAALERMGEAALGVVRALERVPRGPAEEPHWFAAFGRVVSGPWLLGAGALSLLPGLWRGVNAGGAGSRRAAWSRRCSRACCCGATRCRRCGSCSSRSCCCRCDARGGPRCCRSRRSWRSSGSASPRGGAGP